MGANRKKVVGGKGKGGGIVRALNIKNFWALKWHQSDRRVPFGPKKVEMFRALTMAQVMDLPASKL